MQLLNQNYMLLTIHLSKMLKKKYQLMKMVVIGLALGYWKAHAVNQKYQNVNPSKLTEYQTEDQLSMLIEKEQKPAVIYYALAMNKDHSFFRQMMFKYSNLYPDQAIWTVVNVHKKFQEMKGVLDYQYPTRAMLQVRFPKSELAIKLGQNGEFMQLNEKAHRREGFRFNLSEEGFKAFLEDNRIIEGKDPVKSVLNLTKNALFSHIEAEKGKK